MHGLKTGIILVLLLFAGFITAQWGVAGEPEPAASMVSEDQLNTYLEVRQSMSENPAMAPEEIEALLQKHDISREQYDSIDQKVQTSSELREEVEQRLGQEASAQKEMPQVPAVKTKLKEMEPEIPSE